MKVFFAFLAGCASIQAQSASTAYPKVFVEYGSDLDLQVCPSGIADSVVAEAKSKTVDLQKLWTSSEKDLLGTTVAIIGKSFIRQEETVSGLACPNLKGEAKPILVPIWQYLNSTTQGHPFDNRLFVGLTFHELLHRYVDNILGSEFPSTPMLTLYKNEPALVRRHLHVDAIQKAVYLRLGRVDEINEIISNDSKSFGPNYKRAWEIVNHDGVDSFLRELEQ